MPERVDLFATAAYSVIGRLVRAGFRYQTTFLSNKFLTAVAAERALAAMTVFLSHCNQTFCWTTFPDVKAAAR